MSLYIPPNEKEEIKNIVEIETLDRCLLVIRPSQIKLLFKGCEEDSGYYFQMFDDDSKRPIKQISKETFENLKKIMK